MKFVEMKMLLWTYGKTFVGYDIEHVNQEFIGYDDVHLEIKKEDFIGLDMSIGDN